MFPQAGWIRPLSISTTTPPTPYLTEPVLGKQLSSPRSPHFLIRKAALYINYNATFMSRKTLLLGSLAGISFIRECQLTDSAQLRQ